VGAPAPLKKQEFFEPPLIAFGDVVLRTTPKHWGWSGLRGCSRATFASGAKRSSLLKIRGAGVV
jgi:hypothetical protein